MEMTNKGTANWYTTYDDRRYFIEDSPKYNWLQALDECSRRGLQLFVIDDPSKNTAFVNFLKLLYGKPLDLWIGHHDEFNNVANRTWYSAASGEAINYGNWAKGEPNNRFGEHCGQLYRKSDFQWNDEDCDDHYFGYICEEHYLSGKCHKDLEQRHNATNEENLKLLTAFNATQ
ncbi:perlucin-like protein, partial [Musca vetustissima]|uniref:perlucin-like protein n=1 Tax=Musca vetustissima TaxID=27455 RepID=UPI002AB62536